ncbi:MAG: methylamine utilization protein MauJ [Chthonomonadales bacterium]
MKIGRNQLCQCGSGKKYKMCCLGPHPLINGQPDTQPRHMQYPRIDPKIHPDPLVHGHLRLDVYTIAYTYDNPLPNYGTDPRPEGYRGEYHVEFTFQPPSRTVMDNQVQNFDPDLPGGSLLAILHPKPRKPGEAVEIVVDLVHKPGNEHQTERHLKYHFLPNDEGFLSTIKVELFAESIIDAEQTAFRMLAPVLAQWSFVHDVPLDIYRIRTEENATRTCRCLYTRQPYLKVAIDANMIFRNDSIPENYHVLVFYREALSATQPLYQYLCFYKVIELILGLRRQRVTKAGSEGEKPTVITERLQDDPWLTKNVDADLLAKCIGKTFPRLRDDILRPMRVRIAHAFLDDEDPMSVQAEELVNPTDVYRLLPLLKYVARTMVTNELTIV